MSTGLLTLRPTSVIPFWSEPILCLAEARAPRQLQPWPPPHGGSVEGEIPPDDAVGFTTRHGPPGNDGKCLELQINDKAARTFAPATIIGPTASDKASSTCPRAASSALMAD